MAIHAAAKAWDDAHGFSTEFAAKEKRAPYIPNGRPCDRCGKPVERGFIHPACEREEAKFWLRLLYD